MKYERFLIFVSRDKQLDWSKWRPNLMWNWANLISTTVEFTSGVVTEAKRMDSASAQAPWVKGNFAGYGRGDSNSVEYSLGPKIPGCLNLRARCTWCSTFIHKSVDVRYSGQWMQGKRHGLGVENRGHWIYAGEFTQGAMGRYGVKKSTKSQARWVIY